MKGSHVPQIFVFIGDRRFIHSYDPHRKLKYSCYQGKLILFCSFSFPTLKRFYLEYWKSEFHQKVGVFYNIADFSCNANTLRGHIYAKKWFQSPLQERLLHGVKEKCFDFFLLYLGEIDIAPKCKKIEKVCWFARIRNRTLHAIEHFLQHYCDCLPLFVIVLRLVSFQKFKFPNLLVQLENF